MMMTSSSIRLLILFAMLVAFICHHECESAPNPTVLAESNNSSATHQQSNPGTVEHQASNNIKSGQVFHCEVSYSEGENSEVHIFRGVSVDGVHCMIAKDKDKDGQSKIDTFRKVFIYCLAL